MARPLLRLLPAILLLAPLTAAGQGADAPAAAPRSEDPLGAFFKRLARAGTEQVAALLDSMADIDAATQKDHVTALHTAVAYGRHDILSMLLERGARTETLMKPGLTPLSAAAMKNDTDAISLLLKYGAPLNHQTPGGVNALKLACAKGNVDAAQVLLAHGADPTPADEDGNTALTLAQEHAGENRVALMRMLLEHGASPSGKADDDPDPPLMTAILGHDIQAADLLLDFGAPVNSLSHNNSTPLMMASAYGYTALVEHLLNRQAQLTLNDLQGNDALDYAAPGAEFSHVMAAAANGDAPGIRNAAEVDSAATCKLLLERGASVRHVDASGSTPLIIAARVCTPQTVRVLLEHGADVNASNEEGHTALISALLPIGQKLGIILSTPADEALHQRVARHIAAVLDRPANVEETVRLLLNAGADSTRRDATGRSAYDYASTPELRALLIQGPQPGN